MTQQKKFVATVEAKGKAKQLRLYAILAWIIAIAGEVFAILKLLKNDMLTWLIVAILVILALAITGSLLWKKANRMDPASEKERVKFFIQNQLGAIISVLAFLPLVILIFTNKELDGKTKGIAGAIAAIALVVATITGIDFDPASIEKYTEQINQQSGEVMKLTGEDHVFWTPSGNKLHLFEDCYHIGGSDISQGTVKEAWEARKIDNNEVCKTCRKNAVKKLGLADESLPVDNGDEVEAPEAP